MFPKYSRPSRVPSARSSSWPAFVLCQFLLINSVAVTVHAEDALQLLGRGVNFGNMLEVPRDANWGVPLLEEYPRLIKEAGFDAVRIPVRWSAWTDAQPPYRIEPNFLQRVRGLVDACLSQDLKVVLNIHHFDELYENPDAERDRFFAIWRQLSSEFANADQRLFFELLNEPHAKLTADKWNPMLAECLKEVRKLHPNRWVIIGPDHWSNIQALADLQLPADDRRIIVTVHYYLPFDFTHQGASWVSPTRPTGVTWRGTAAEKQALRDDLVQVANWGKQYQRPIYIGEFGAFQAADMASRVRWTASVREICEELKFGWAYWELAAGFGILDPQTLQWRESLTDALIPNRP